MDEKDEKIMVYIGEVYQHCMQQGKHKNVVSEQQEMDDKSEFIFYIENILRMMPLEYSLIIRNDYLIKRKAKWWEAYYSKSTYYRLRNEAIRAFVRCVNM